MKKWDVFISHASEDKQDVALPLAETLLRCGLKVWLDFFELNVGDSLREKIDDGLSQSEFGIVILSEHFLKKQWPKKELNGLFAMEGDAKLILPVWHGLDKETVAEYSPILADRLAANTNDGITSLAKTIAEAIQKERSRQQPDHASITRQFIDILNQEHSPRNISTFLMTYRGILPTALGRFGLLNERANYLIAPQFGNYSPDLVYGDLVSTQGRWKCYHFFFRSVNESFSDQGPTAGAWKQTVDNAEQFQKWLSSHSDEISKVLLPDKFHSCRCEHQIIILMNRRDQLTDFDRQCIDFIKSKEIEIRTYDWLIVACNKAQ